MPFNKEKFLGIVKREHLEPLITTLMEMPIPKVWPLNIIVVCIKLAAYTAYVATLFNLAKIEAEANKQEYEQKQTLSNNSTVDDPISIDNTLDG